ncbi:hypothetical protein BASA81_001151 [Batrachochytrium salamandrivorans]|nr:hypothetical protein BASA81_001151 [Batrachochytrium salamandrivorans]
MSIRLFRDSMVIRPDGSIDASGVVSKACFQEWLKARNINESVGDAKRYQRVLSNHLSGVDGRCPFTEEEEEAILKVVRRKERWPCFGPNISIGHTGFRSKGYHEKQRERDSLPPPSLGARTAATLPLYRPPVAHLPPMDCATMVEIGYRLKQYLEAFDAVGVDVWESVLGIFKFMIGTKAKRGRTYIPQPYVHELCQRHSTDHTLVVVMDLAEPFTSRVVAQNELAGEMLGRVVGYCPQRLILSECAGECLVSLGQAYQNPGMQFSAKLQLRRNGNSGVVDLFTCAYVDPQSGLLVLFGMP